MSPSFDQIEAVTPLPSKVAKAVKGPHSPLPEVRVLDASTVTVDELVDALKVTGGVIIRNILTQEEVQAIEKDVRPWLEQDGPWKGGADFFPPETRRATGLLTKSRTYALRMVGHPLWTGVTDALLTSTLKNNWNGDKNEVSVSKPQLSSTAILAINPGAKDQGLHRDDQIHHMDQRAVAEHVMGRDSMMGFFVAGSRTTRQNGATRFVPGSHLWDYSEGPASDYEHLSYYAELAPGDGFMMLGGCYHGGSANTTADEERLVYSAFNIRGWLRQEEIQYLAHSTEKLRELPDWLLERAGFAVSKPFLGWVELKSPMALLYPERDGYEELV